MRSVARIACLRVKVSVVLVILSVCVLDGFSAETPSLRLVEESKSAYRIYRSPAAPTSVKQAAEEMQRVIKIATGAELAVVEAAASPMIALGGNAVAEAAGIRAADLPEEGFRMVTQGNDLFIVGNDTLDDQYSWGSTRGGGTSRGTLFGVYAFLENIVGVRWLMPGPWGEDIPAQKSLSVPSRSLVDAPDFKMRKLHCGQSSDLPKARQAMVDEWLRRQRIGGSHIMWNTHSWYPSKSPARWNDYLPEDLFEQHPEYRAVDGDQDKFCTSNPEMVQLFAEGVSRWIDRYPEDRYFTISPSDGGGFCRCAKCAAQEEPDPHGDSSCSPLVLKFYNDVARIVGKKHPDKILTGYVYYNYMYPPQKPLAMEPNVHLVWAALEYYGLGLYKPKYREEFDRVSRGWAKMAPDFSYECWTCWMRSDIGAPLPPPIELIKVEIPTMKRAGAKGFHLIGLPAFGYGAPLNYLAAKLMWRAESDVDRLYHEWLQRAYGPGWRSMKQLFAMLDDAFRKNKRREKVKHNYDVNYAVVMDVYVPRFARMEQLYLAARAKAETEAQRQRLQMFGDNLVELHHYLRQAGLLADAEKSVFYRSDDDYQKFLASLAPTATLNPTRSKNLWVFEQRKLAIPRLAKDTPAPQIDGDLSDVAWQQAAVADDFRIVGSREQCPHPVTARVIFDEHHLYIAFDCEEKKAEEVLARCTEADRPGLFADVTVEVFFRIDPAAPAWWHLALNPLNTHWDGLNNDAGKSLAWDSVVKVNGNRWTAEFRIPFQSLDLDRAPYGKTWTGNLCRTSYRLGQESRVTPCCASWNSLEERFAEPDHFGEWVFAEEPVVAGKSEK